MKSECHTVRHELVENVFPVSQPHYSKMRCPLTKPNLTDFFENSTHRQWKLAKERRSSKVCCLTLQPGPAGARAGRQHWNRAHWSASRTMIPRIVSTLCQAARMLMRSGNETHTGRRDSKINFGEPGPCVPHTSRYPTWNSCLDRLRWTQWYGGAR